MAPPRIPQDLPNLVSAYCSQDPMHADRHRRQGRLVGLGRPRGIDCTISGIDLDHCYRDGMLNRHARETLSLIDSFAEKSPGGRGLHIVELGDIGTTKTQDRSRGLGICTRGACSRRAAL